MISNYTELKNEISDWLGDDTLSNKVETIIQLAEARLNRKLKSVRTDVDLTGTLSSRRIDISAYDVIAPIALYMTTDGDEEFITNKPDGSFPYKDDNDEPSFYALDGNNDYIDFDCPLDEAHTFRFRYWGRFALSDSATTNQLLTDHPDVYFAACLMWGGIRHQDSELVAGYKSILDEFMNEAGRYLAQPERGLLTVDPMLVVSNRYDDSWNQTE